MSYVGCIYVYNVYVFLMDSSLEFFEVSYGSLFMAFVLKSTLSYISISTLGVWGFFYVCLLGTFFSILSLSVSVGLLFCGGSVVDSIYVDHVFLSIQPPYVF